MQRGRGSNDSSALKSFRFALVFSLLAGLEAIGQVVNPHAGERIGTVQEVYDGTLLPISRSIPSATSTAFSRLALSGAAAASTLSPQRKALKNVRFKSNGSDYDLYDYVSLNRVSGLLVLKDGKIALETYQLGNHENTRWMSMSVVKSITATLIGAAIKDGHIRSIDDPLTRYLPELSTSAYDGVTVRDLLQMASGVSGMRHTPIPSPTGGACWRCRVSQQSGGVLALMAQVAARGNARKPLELQHRRDARGGRIVARGGAKASGGLPLRPGLGQVRMESDATWWLESENGLEVGGSGLSATLRDYGRFGLFLLGGGKAGGEQILPDDWVKDAGSPKIVSGQPVDYGYMHWPIPNGRGTIHEDAFEARGIFGQHVYMNPREKVVVVVWGALPKPTGKNLVRDNDFFAAVSQALR